MKVKKIATLLIITILLELIALKNYHISLTPPTQPDQYVRQIISTCSTSSYHEGCYEAELLKLKAEDPALTMEELFSVTKIVQNQDSSFKYCHGLGHKLAETEVSKDPSKWQEVVTRCPVGMCANGCTHGAVQAKFKSEVLNSEQIQAILPDLATVCQDRANWPPTPADRAACYHGLGHLAMYVTGGEIKQSLAICDAISQIASQLQGLRYNCDDGVFMILYQPAEIEEKALVKGKQPTKQSLESFCQQFKGLERNACLMASWPIFETEIQNNPDSMLTFCAKLPDYEQVRCYDTLSHTVAMHLGTDLDKIKSYCNKLPEQAANYCLSFLGLRIAEANLNDAEKAVSLCLSIKDQNIQDVCLGELARYSQYNLKSNSEASLKFCSLLPSSWSNQCEAKI